MVDLLFKYATRSRPKWFKNTLNRYYSFLSGNHSFKFIISCDKNDKTMNNNKMINFLESKNNLEYYFNRPPQTKVTAINANLEKMDGKVLICVSDDMVPVVRGYDSVILRKMAKFFPDYDGALHSNDGRVGKSLLTLSIMGHKMYEYFGYIYHPDYISLWCDNEFMTVTKQINKYKYIDKVVIQHKWGEQGRDRLYLKNESYYTKDMKTFNKRKKLGFPKKSVL